MANVNRERQELQLLKTKGDRPRAVPIPVGLYTELLAYLLEHGRRGALFRTAHKIKRIRSCDVCDVVTAAAQRAGLRCGVTARTLRHAFATHLMDRGVDLAIIASLMGHRSPQETGVYLHVLPQRPQAAVRTLRIGDPSDKIDGPISGLPGGTQAKGHTAIATPGASYELADRHPQRRSSKNDVGEQP